MFYQIRFQTGEISELISEMQKGSIPCMDVDDAQELNWVINELAQKGIHRVSDIPFDKNAQDKIKEPEFEFRIAFVHGSETGELQKSQPMYIDFYSPIVEDETYDSIFGD